MMGCCWIDKKIRLDRDGFSVTKFRSGLLFDRHFDNLVIATNRIDHGHISGFAKDGVQAIEVALGAMADEELTAAGVRATVGHRETACLMTVGIAFGFAGDAVAWATRASAVGAAALDHKVGNHPMEHQAIVKAFFRQFDEVLDGAWGLGLKQFEIDGALVGFHDGAGHTRTPLILSSIAIAHHSVRAEFGKGC
jgi:hypothetical protein